MMFYVYILSNRSGGISAGVTRDIAGHLRRHPLSIAPACAHKHQFDRLLLVETFRCSALAAAREQHLNRCSLTEKLELIRAANPKFNDLTSTVSAAS
jgi:predicted GIY-YIG superfamily endonuclease